tara:strand:+ start:78 stop:1106 length:1029 start_codon:yes stop_codon:yes gene_type:complete
MDIIEIIFRHHPELASAMMRGEGIGADLTRGQLRRMFGTLRHRPRKETEAIIRAFRQNPAALRSALAQSAGFGSGAAGASLGITNPLLRRGRLGMRVLGKGALTAGTAYEIGKRLKDVAYPIIRDDLPGVAEQDDLRLQRQLLEGSPVLTEAAERFMAGRRADDLERALVEQATGIDEATLSSEAARRRQEARRQEIADFNNNRVRPAAPEVTRQRQDERNLEELLSEFELTGPAIRDNQFMPQERPLSRLEKARFQRDRRVNVPYAGRTRYDLDIPDHMRRTATVSRPQPPAITEDMIRARRRLQPTAPGIFGELLDESITDFQGAPMMSEREILRLIRGE